MALDQHFMVLALREAQKAFARGEVPVGAVVVYQGRVIGRGHNRVEARQDATQHAELIALRQAGRKLKTWRLAGCTLYVTLEPCAMCAGAVVWSRMERLVYGAQDPKAGACGSVLQVPACPGLNHHPLLAAGVLEQESRAMLQKFFRELRIKKRQPLA